MTLKFQLSKSRKSTPKTKLKLDRQKTESNKIEKMDENNTNPSAAGSAGPGAAAAQQQQQLLLQQQLFMMQQQQQQHHHQQQQRPRPQIQQQQSHLQQAMSRFPSNIDAHLRAPGLRSFQFAQNQNQIQQQQQQQQQQAQLQQQQQQQMARSGAQTTAPVARNPEVEMALQDAFKVCNPDVRSPFSSIEDAVTRLLPYHVVSDYEAEEDDKILESDKTGQVPSRLQQWDHNILVKIAEFTSTFEKQVLAFNIMTRKRSHGEFRSEERLLLEQALIQEERRAAMEAKVEMEAREKVARMAAMVQPDLLGPGPPRTAMRSHAVAAQNEDAPDHHQPPAWVVNNNNNNNNNEENGEEGEEDFLNNGEDGGEDEDGEFDLNAR